MTSDARKPPRSETPRSEQLQAETRRALLTSCVLVISIIALAWLSLRIGAGDLSDPALRSTLISLRTARLGSALLVGAALATGGVVVQGLFRNPLAAPSILGTTAGASFGGQAALLLHAGIAGSAAATASLPAELWLPLGCAAGALGSLILLLAFVRRGTDSVTLLLVGFILSALLLSLSGLLTSWAQDSYELGRTVVAFSLGGLSGVGPRHVALALPLVVAGAIAAWLWGRPLDVLLSGEDEAASLGVDVTAVRRWAVIWVALLTAAAVAVAGNVSFVGLVVPQAMRRIVGAEHRRLLPVTLLAGAALVLACDVAVRVLPTATEVPLGVVTGLVGGPVFLVLLIRGAREARDG